MNFSKLFGNRSHWAFAFFCLLSSTFLAACGGGGGGGGGTSDDGGTPVEGVAASFTDDEDYGAVMVNEDGESLAAITEPVTGGSALVKTGLKGLSASDFERVIGAVWTGADGTSVSVFLDADGLPERAVFGDFIFLFSYSDDHTTMDATIIYVPTEHIEILEDLAVDADDLDTLAGLARSTLIRRSLNAATCSFPNCETAGENLVDALKIAGLALTASACVVGGVGAGGLPTLACTGLIIGLAGHFTHDDTLEATSTVFTAFGCVHSTVECVAFAAELSGAIGDEYFKHTVEHADLINTALMGTTQEGGGLPSCPGTYECTPGTFLPCFESGAKECQDDCTWGSCGTAPSGFCSGGECADNAGGCVGCNSGFYCTTGSAPANNTCGSATNGVICCQHNCGNGTCDSSSGETNSNCPFDCSADCGNGSCAGGETNDTCPADCSADCGDGICDSTAGEDNSACEADCPIVCGDGFCSLEGGEPSSCAVDCPSDSCCSSSNGCPGETPTECTGSCAGGCCCGLGQTCQFVNTVWFCGAGT